MLTFTLAVSCLTAYNLPWFMDLTFKVPMQYSSLQHQTLLPSPVTSTTECYCFGSSFFLELFLHWSPVAYWAPTSLGSSSFGVRPEIIGRGHSPTHQQKIGLKIYWAWPRPSEQDPFSPSVSLSHQEASISLLSFSIRGQTEWKPQSQNTNQSDHMDHSLV